MTSANTIEYIIYTKEGTPVGRHHQNIMCKTCNDGLEQHQPPENFMIQAWGYDEYEDQWEDEPVPLDKWLATHKAEITFKTNGN